MNDLDDLINRGLEIYEHAIATGHSRNAARKAAYENTPGLKDIMNDLDTRGTWGRRIGLINQRHGVGKRKYSPPDIKITDKSSNGNDDAGNSIVSPTQMIVSALEALKPNKGYILNLGDLTFWSAATGTSPSSWTYVFRRGATLAKAGYEFEVIDGREASFILRVTAIPQELPKPPKVVIDNDTLAKAVQAALRAMGITEVR